MLPDIPFLSATLFVKQSLDLSKGHLCDRHVKKNGTLCVFEGVPKHAKGKKKLNLSLYESQTLMGPGMVCKGLGPKRFDKKSGLGQKAVWAKVKVVSASLSPIQDLGGRNPLLLGCHTQTEVCISARLVTIGGENSSVSSTY